MSLPYTGCVLAHDDGQLCARVSIIFPRAPVEVPE